MIETRKVKTKWYPSSFLCQQSYFQCSFCEVSCWCWSFVELLCRRPMGGIWLFIKPSQLKEWWGGKKSSQARTTTILMMMRIWGTISRGNISRFRVMCGPWSIRIQHEVTILKCKSSRQQNYFNSRTNTAASRTNASYLEDKSKLSWEQMREMCRRNPVGPFLGHQLCQAGPPHAFTLLSLLVVTNLLYLCWP